MSIGRGYGYQASERAQDDPHAVADDVKADAAELQEIEQDKAAIPSGDGRALPLGLEPQIIDDLNPTYSFPVESILGRSEVADGDCTKCPLIARV